MRCNPPMSKGELEFYEALLKQTEAPCFTRCRRTECGRTARTSSAHPNLRRMPNLPTGNLQRHPEAWLRRNSLRRPNLRSIPPKSGSFAQTAGKCFHEEPPGAASRSVVELAYSFAAGWR